MGLETFSIYAHVSLKMKLKDLVKKLIDKPEQANTEVQFCIWTSGGILVYADMGGPMTRDLMKVFAKHSPKASKGADQKAP